MNDRAKNEKIELAKIRAIITGYLITAQGYNRGDVMKMTEFLVGKSSVSYLLDQAIHLGAIIDLRRVPYNRKEEKGEYKKKGNLFFNFKKDNQWRDIVQAYFDFPPQVAKKPGSTGLFNKLQGLNNNNNFKRLTVFKGDFGIPPVKTNTWDDVIFERFWTRACWRILELVLVDKATKIGIAYGRTLKSMIAALGNIAGAGKVFLNEVIRKSDSRPVNVFPLMGFLETEDINEIERSSHTIASALRTVFNSWGFDTSKEMPTLCRLPVFFDLLSSADNWAPFRIGIAKYNTIFGCSGLFHKADALLLSVGVDGHPLGITGEEFKKEMNLNKQAYECVFGDLAGVFIPKKPNDKEVQSWNSRMGNGVTPDMIIELANRAKKRRKPGVIVFAMGENKVSTVYHLVRLGYINELVIDQTLAMALTGYG